MARGLPMKLFPGKVDPPGGANFVLADSLAQAIDNEFVAALQAVKGIAPPADGADDRKLLFLAIARGILRYLQDRPHAWHAVNNGGIFGHEHDVTVDVDLDTPN
jgi:hypothetical protein